MGKRKRTMLIAGAAAAVLAGVGIAGVAGHKHRVLAAACDSVTAYAQQTGGAVHYAGEGPRVVVLGDSYATGDLLDNRRGSWPAQYASDTGADVYVVGEGGTGFTNAGFCGSGRFADRLDAALALTPDTLIVAGGLNDVGASVETAAEEVLQRSADVPSVVLVGPADAPGREGESVIDRELQSAATSEQRAYVSALSFDLHFLSDDTHLTPEGHVAYARSLESQLPG